MGVQHLSDTILEMPSVTPQPQKNWTTRLKTAKEKAIWKDTFPALRYNGESKTTKLSGGRGDGARLGGRGEGGWSLGSHEQRRVQVKAPKSIERKSVLETILSSPYFYISRVPIILYKELLNSITK